jgi:two-component system chemotaxis sensor kinase CheA
MARARFTLDDAALELLQLEADDLAGARRLRDRVHRLAGKVGAVEAALLHDAAAALEAHARGEATAGTDLIGDAGRAIELAMNARDQVEHARHAVHEQEAEAKAPRASTPLPMDPLMLAALEAFEAEEAQAAPAVVPMPQLAPSADKQEQRSLLEAADAELLEGFVSESEEYLRDAETALLALERDPTDTEAVNRVFRCFHTIKGTSAFLGLDPISKLAHRAESLLSRARDGEIRLTGTYSDLSLQAIDVLNALVRKAIGGGAPPETYDVVMAALSGSDAAPSQAAAEPSCAPVPAGNPPAAARSEPDANGESYTRVRTDRLDQMLDIIGEMVIAHAMIAEDELMASGGHELVTRKVAHAGKIVRELQDLSISMRMVPMKALFQKLARVCRDTARKSGKTVDFLTDGEDTEIDRNMVDVVGDPLIHMVRNAVDHGIEMPDARRNARKPARGLVRLSAHHAGGSVVVTLEDDGRGLDHDRLVAKAVAKGLVDADRTLSEREVHELIFAPGFSTADQVTDLSGRGVGMDVVRRNIESLRGRIEIDSQAGRGSRFTIRLPLTLAITDGMMVRVGAERYIVPNVSIQMSFRPDRSALSTVIGRGELVSLRGEILPIVRLHRVLDIANAVEDPAKALLVIVGSAERRCALLVDELLGQHQVVAKSLGEGIGKIPGVSGGAILGDGRVGLILDVPELLALPRVAAREKVA